MSVLHLLGTAGEGGAETYFLDLIAALADDGVKQAAAIRANPNREAALRRLDVPTGVFRFGGPIDLLTRPKLKAFAGRQDVKLALAWMNRAAVPPMTPRWGWEAAATRQTTKITPTRPKPMTAALVKKAM